MQDLTKCSNKELLNELCNAYMDWMDLRARVSDWEEEAFNDYEKVKEEVLKRMKG